MEGGLPKFEMYNILRDPREEVGNKIGIYPYLQFIVPFGQLVQAHLELMQQFPDRELDPKTGKEVEARRRATSSWEIGADMQ